MAAKESAKPKVTRLTNVATGVVVNVDEDTAAALGAGWFTDAKIDGAQADYDEKAAADRAAADKAEADRVAALERSTAAAKAGDAKPASKSTTSKASTAKTADDNGGTGGDAGAAS